MAAKASNHKDTYRATAVFLALMGILYLADRLIGFSSHGLSWVMQKDTMLLYAAVAFLWFKADKSVGIILAGIWLIQKMSGYLLPASLLLIGILLYWLSSR